MRTTLLVLIAAALSMSAGCKNDENTQNPFAVRPSFLTGEPTRTDYDGVNSGLVTGSAKDLVSLLAFAAPAGDPTPATLRTLQIQSSYFGLIDLSPGGGFGTYFGILDPRANKGTEYIAGGWAILAPIRTGPGSGHRVPGD
jgi:hydroxybutyrate-dimer hydrolase